MSPLLPARVTLLCQAYDATAFGELSGDDANDRHYEWFGDSF